MQCLFLREGVLNTWVDTEDTKSILQNKTHKRLSKMTYLQLAYAHLATIVPAFIIASYLLFTRKGTNTHRMLGRIYMILMLVTATIALFMPAEVGPRFFNHFGFIHLFCLLVFYLVPSAYFAIKKGNIEQHKGKMIGLYVGGLIIAGSFTFMPGRLLHGWIIG